MFRVPAFGVYAVFAYRSTNFGCIRRLATCYMLHVTCSSVTGCWQACFTHCGNPTGNASGCNHSNKSLSLGDRALAGVISYWRRCSYISTEPVEVQMNRHRQAGQERALNCLCMPAFREADPSRNLLTSVSHAVAEAGYWWHALRRENKNGNGVSL